MDASTPASSPAPGWYRDPSGRHHHRYWDGRGWTEHVSPPVNPLAVAPVPPGPAYPDVLLRVPLATLGQRLGAHLLDQLLLVVTLGVGWLLWCCFTFPQGQTPAKAMLGHRVVRQDTGQPAGWGDMFLRTIVLKLGLMIISVFLLGIPALVATCFIFSGDLRQTGWDRMAGTLVVVGWDRHTAAESSWR